MAVGCILGVGIGRIASDLMYLSIYAGNERHPRLVILYRASWMDERSPSDAHRKGSAL